MKKKILIIIGAAVLVALIIYFFYQKSKEEKLPDLTVEPGNIFCSSQEIKAGDFITVSAIVFNNGNKKAQNILIQFFEGNPEKGGQKIQETRINLINSKQNQDVSINWEASFGLQEIYILIDANNEIKELNEENNKTGIQILAVLPVIETKELNKKEFLENSEVEELYKNIKNRGFGQMALANHFVHSEKTESLAAVMVSEKKEKLGYLIKFDSKEYDLPEEPFWMEFEEQGELVFISGQTEIGLKDGQLYTTEQAHSCNKGHCWGGCIVYNIFVNEITSEVLETACKACYYAVFVPIPEPVHIAAPCATCAGVVGTIAAVCGGLCLNDPCLYCMSDACGDSKWLGEPYCLDNELLYQEYDGYSCSNPITIRDVLPGAPDLNSYVNTSHCDRDKGPKLKDDCPAGRFKRLGFGEPYCSEDGIQIIKDEKFEKGYCDQEFDKCVSISYSVPQLATNCSDYPCQYSFDLSQKPWCENAQCVCCEQDEECLPKTTVGQDLGYVCIDQDTLGKKIRFNEYKCQDSPPEWEVFRTCFEYMTFENTKERDCGQDYIWGSWQCKADNKTRFRKYGLYDYKCQGEMCVPGKLITTEKTETESCSNYCYEGQCVECLEADHCGEDSINWGEWVCDGRDSLKREGDWLDYRCTEEHKCQLETKDKLETKPCPNNLPKCFLELNKCVQCLTNEQCPVSKICGPDYTCIGCANDSQCPADDLIEKTRCDGNTLLTEIFRYKYSCENGNCKKGEAKLDSSTEKVCDKTCYQGKCVDCVYDGDCGSVNYGSWQGDWYCKNNTTAGRQTGYYASKCVDKIYCITEQVPETEETKQCASNERCQLGQCLKSYGLIVGQGAKVIKFSETLDDFSVLPPPSGFTNNLYDVDFYPGGALIVGDSQGSVLQYNGQALTEILNFNQQGNYTGIAFRPGSPNYGLIVGDKIVQRVLAGDFPILSGAGSNTGNDVAWKPDGSYSLIIEDGAVFKYNPSSGQFSSLYIPEDILTTIPGFENATWSNANIPLVEIDWKPDGSEAFIISDIGIILKYNGSSFTVDYDPNNPPYTVNWQAVALNPDNQYALIVGSQGIIEKYNGNSFTIIPADSSIDFNGIAWISSTKALIVGGKWQAGSVDGQVLVYDSSSGSLTTLLSGINSFLLGLNW